MSDSHKEEIHRKIQKIEADNGEIYRQFTSHSSDYKEALELSEHDLETLQHAVPRGGESSSATLWPTLEDRGKTGFTLLTARGEEFALKIENVCGVHYGGKWALEIMAICLSNPNLNRSTGGGTTLINVVPEEYHQEIMRCLKPGGDIPKAFSDAF